jgi:predicted AlkP superfamily pyrophosphatase or phosphodiesterase
MLIGALVIAGGLLFPAAKAGAQTPDSDRVVVMISLDGLAGFYLDDPKAEMPNLRALAAAGARADSMEVSTPSVTWPNHTTLVTGDTPARHGVVGNNYFDRATGKGVVLIGDPVFDKDQIVKVPTIYDLAHDAGMTTAALRWPATRNARTLNWTVPTCHNPKAMERYTTPALMADCKAANIWYAHKTDAKGEVDHRARDEASIRIFNWILHAHRPRLALLHLDNVDHTQHLHGPRSAEAYTAVRQADAQVQEVRAALETEFPHRATLIVTSDHGFSPIDHAIYPNVILRKKGLIEVNGARVVGGSVKIVPQGGCAMLYITADAAPGPAARDAIVRRVKQAFDGATGVASVLGPEQLHDYGVGDAASDPRCPDLLLFAKEGYVFGDTAAGALEFVDKPERRGSHGHDPHLPDLHGLFVAWGSGIKPGVRLGEIRNTAVAPTIAALLGIRMPDTDGRPLAAALRD